MRPLDVLFSVALVTLVGLQVIDSLQFQELEVDVESIRSESHVHFKTVADHDKGRVHVTESTWELRDTEDGPRWFNEDVGADGVLRIDASRLAAQAKEEAEAMKRLAESMSELRAKLDKLTETMVDQGEFTRHWYGRVRGTDD